MKRSIFVLIVLIIITSLVGSACVPSKPGDNSQNDGSHYSVASDNNDNSTESDTKDSESVNVSESLKESENESESESENESDSSPESTSESEIDEDIEPTDAKWFKFILLDDGSGYSVAKSDNYRDDPDHPTEIVIPKTYNGKPVVSIADEAFWGCGDLKSIKISNNITSIGLYSFFSCTSLTSITIPRSVKSFGYGVFCECFNIEKLEVASGNKTFHSANNCIIETSTKTLAVGCKTSVIPSDGSVEKIGDFAFSGCHITDVEIPSGVTDIGNWTFFTCNRLTSVKIPYGVTNIGDYVFSGCGSLTSVDIPDSVTSIGICAFLGCKLTSVDIPDSVVSIADSAFPCPLTSIFIPAGVAHIGKGAFGSGLEKIEVSRNNAVYYSVNNCIIRKGMGTLVMGCKNSIIPSDRLLLSVIGEEAFYGSGLTSITIPHNITRIEEDAFRGSGLISITILNSQISIDERAFRACPKLKSVTFEGTKEQWMALYKDGIFAETQVSAVKCSDGEFEI